VVILILAAVITPPDILSQVIVSIPIIGLYEIGILVAKRAGKKDKSE
jgi:sec-independent protein translocase protein TatC